MRHILGTTTYLLLAILCLGLSACSMVGGKGQQSTPTAVPTSIVPGAQVVQPQMCQVSEQGMVRVEQPQGDLMSWSPTTDILAYVASTAESSWNVGDLDILSAPGFDAPIRLASQVAGEVTWAPDATSIAYLGLRRSDNLYTIGLAYPNGRPAIDLFPDEAARTDDYSSQKSILEWMNSGRLRVFVSCGANCLQTMDIGVLTGLSSKVGDPLERYWGMYMVHTFHPSFIPDEYAALKGQLNWSWDDQHIAYIDEQGGAFVIDEPAATIFALDIGAFGTATETDWSYDSQYLAVQVDQNLKVFSFHCP